MFSVSVDGRNNRMCLREDDEKGRIDVPTLIGGSTGRTTVYVEPVMYLPVVNLVRDMAN